MKQKSKFFVLILALVICFSVFSITAFADEDDVNSDVNSDVSQIDPDYNEQPVDPDPNTGNSDITEPDYNGGNSDIGSDYSDNGSSDSYDNNAGSSYNDNNGYDSYDNNVYEDNYSYDDYNTNNDVNSYDEYSENYSYDNYETVPEADLYNTDGKIDDRVLSDNDWNSIAQSLQNADDSGDGDDFNFIKNNNSRSDNGIWMLITGAVLIILAIVGIAYVILSNMNKKKNFAFSGSYNNSSAKNSNRASSYKAKDDYDDGFSSFKNKPKKFADKKRIDDTAEIFLPKNNRNNNNRNNRYR